MRLMDKEGRVIPTINANKVCNRLIKSERPW